MSYRQTYEERVGKHLPQDWDIHHLDRNRKNNNFMNLVALPSDVHKKYHYILKQLETNYCILFNFTSIKSEINSFGISYHTQYQHNIIYELCMNSMKLEEIEKEIIQYVRLRNEQAQVTLNEILTGGNN